VSSTTNPREDAAHAASTDCDAAGPLTPDERAWVNRQVAKAPRWNDEIWEEMNAIVHKQSRDIDDGAA
jgi:hypothetical protein